MKKLFYTVTAFDLPTMCLDHGYILSVPDMSIIKLLNLSMQLALKHSTQYVLVNNHAGYLWFSDYYNFTFGFPDNLETQGVYIVARQLKHIIEIADVLHCPIKCVDKRSFV